MDLFVSGGNMNTNQSLVENSLKSLEDVFLAMVKNIDERDVNPLEDRFHKNYSDHVHLKGTDSVICANKESYLQSLRDGKLGGVERKIQIKSYSILDHFGIVNAELRSAVMKFQTQYSFVWEGGDWKLIHALVAAEKV